MKVAALYDVHGNAPALEAVLAAVDRERVDLVVFGGDLAAGLLPRETVDLARTVSNARFVQGNADREPNEWLSAQLDDEQRAFLQSFEQTVVADDVLYCHATPHDDMPIFTRVSPDERVRELIGDVAQGTVVCGHTHMQFERVVEGRRIVNAGSVGMPYGTTDACWALVVDGVPEHRRTTYDLEAAAARFRAASVHPDRDVLIAENVLVTPSEQEAIDYFEQLAAAS